MNQDITETTSNDVDRFSPVFKHFRRLPDRDCFAQAFSVATHPTYFHQCHSTTETIPMDLDLSLGLRPPSTWSLYACTFCDGLYLLSNPFTCDGQRHWIEECLNNYAQQTKTNLGDAASNTGDLTRLRWATLGYHYDWTNKIYTKADHTAMPVELERLCRTIAQFISQHTDCSMMRAEAAIVNYYFLNSTLCAHTDHSEVDALTMPLLSFSFGNAAVFLIGGRTKSECEPSPILLRSGDILLMTGSSRLYFHAIPRILRDPFLSDTLLSSDTENDNVEHWWSYICDKRININVRQVYTET